jgi:hypothetical protein
MVKKLVTLKKLPASMTRGIGRIMVADAYLDLALSQSIYLLTGVGQKEGRLAIREPRTEERLDLILDLAKVHKITVKTDIKLFREAIQASTTNRDLVGHGVWFREPNDGRLLVRKVKGQWNERGEKTSKRILPQGVPVDEGELAVMLGVTEEAIAMAEEIKDEIEAGLAALPRTPR